MISKISKKLRSYTGTSFIFMGLAVVILGSSIVRLGAWVSDIKVLDVDYDDNADISEEELAQVIKEAREARRDEE
jgi:hypothetical protein